MLKRSELIELYRVRAKRYDITANFYYLLGFREWQYRKRAIEALTLQPGDTVVEIGCGTGLNFSLLQAQVGPSGRIIGVDMTDAMLDKARERIDRNDWLNVELVHCDAASYEFPKDVCGIISTFALTLVPEFDQVIQRGTQSLPAGGHWVVADLRMPDNWFRHFYPLLIPLFRPFGVTLDLADRHPWESIEKYLRETTMEEYFLGFTYVASGVK